MDAPSAKCVPCSVPCFKKWFRKNLFLILNLLGITIGFCLGLILRNHVRNNKEDILLWIALPGDIYMSLLKMTIVPLIISATITCTASLDPKANGKVGCVATAYFICGNLFGASLGSVLTLMIKPYKMIQHSNMSEQIEQRAMLKTTDIFMDMLRVMFPDNIVRATIQKIQTKYIELEEVTSVNTTDGFHNTTTLNYIRETGYTDSTNILGLIVLSCIFGIATGLVKEKGKPFLNCIESLYHVVVLLLGWVLWVTPIGICSLISVSIAEVNDISKTFIKLGLFVLTVSLGIALQELLYYPLVHFIFTRRSPFKVMLKLCKAWLFALATASSLSSLPELIKISKKFQHDFKTSSFVLYYGMTIYAGGSALFQSAAVIFIAGLVGIQLNGGQIIVVIIVITMSCLAVPAVPSASIVMVFVVLTTFKIPPHYLGILFAVEWLLDRIRTTSNMLGIYFGVPFVAHLCLEESENITNYKLEDLKGTQKEKDILFAKDEENEIEDIQKAYSNV